MVTHLFWSVNFQFEECDCCCDKEMTTAVHVGKEHSEIILCGMCDSVVGNKENLETHMVTCEIYQCYFDDYKFKTLGDLHKHVKGKHAEQNKHFKFIH